MSLSVETRSEVARGVVASLVADPPTVLPPMPMMKTIGSPSVEHYLTNMQRYVGDIIEQTGLPAHGAVLDIGSGCGRLATAFTRYLAPEGRYVGIDVWDEGVQWCRDHITTASPQFEFQTVSASNNYYYTADSGEPNQFDLSFLPGDGFDVVVALSVFTHLRLADAQQYYALIRRVLKPGGLAYLTFFVIDEDSHRYVRETGNHRALAPAGDGMWYAYEKQWFFSGCEDALLLQQFDAHGLDVVRRSPGLWAQKPGGRLYQDWFLLGRRD